MYVYMWIHHCVHVCAHMQVGMDLHYVCMCKCPGAYGSTIVHVCANSQEHSYACVCRYTHSQVGRDVPSCAYEHIQVGVYWPTIMHVCAFVHIQMTTSTQTQIHHHTCEYMYTCSGEYRCTNVCVHTSRWVLILIVYVCANVQECMDPPLQVCVHIYTCLSE